MLGWGGGGLELHGLVAACLADFSEFSCVGLQFRT